MARATEQIASIIKANTENALKAGLLSVEHAERFLDLHVRNIRIALEHSIVALSAIPFATDARKLMALRQELADVAIREGAGYSQSIYQVAADAGYDFSALAEVAGRSCTAAVAAWTKLRAEPS